MAEDAQGPHDIGEDSTILAPERTVDGPLAPAPRLNGLVHEVGRQRVRHALFGETSPSFRVGRYVVTRTLGRGGMGVVFEALDPELDRRVALKVLRAEIDEQDTIRLRREAQAMAKLSHSNVVQVYEVGQAEGRTFVAMELIGGQTLEDWMRRAPRPTWRQCVEVFVQVGAGLAAAHEQGLIHRDFKPSNAIVDDEGRARVLDFGLARRAGESLDDDTARVPRPIQQTRTDEHQIVPLDVSLTTTGAVLGTPAYMPPEQMRGQEADPRSDQFSFCVALYEAVYGERPYEGRSMQALMRSMESDTTRPAHKGSDAPRTLRVVLQRGLAFDPGDRWASMEVLLEQLRRLIAPRRWRWLALGGGLALGLVGLGTTLATPQLIAMQERCSGARAQLDGIWDDARRHHVQAAVLRTELSYAEGTWERIGPRLDEYADAWIGKHTEVCEATAVHHEQTEDVMTLRMGCLQQRRTALRAATTVLASADAHTKTVQNAVELVVELPELSRCDDVERLERQRQRMPPPEDPQVAEQVQELRDTLADVNAMDKAGRYSEALTQVRPVMEQARALGYGPLHAEAVLWQARLLARDGHYDDAEQELKRAHALAIEHEHDEAELGAAQALIIVTGFHLAQHDDGLTWGQTAVALAKRGDDDLELASSLNNLGNVLSSLEEYEQARRHYRQALEILERSMGLDHPHVAMSLSGLGNVLGRLGEHEQARSHHQRALRVLERVLGPDHPHVATSLDNLGGMFARTGEYEQAQLHYQRALKISQEALGPDHPHVATSLNNLSNVLKELGEYEQAQLHSRQALQIWKKALGPDHPNVAANLNNLGNVLKRIGDYEQAQLHYQNALQTWQKALGPDHPKVALTLYNLGGVFERLGDYEQAQLHYQRSLRIWQKALGHDHPEVAYPLVGLATTALAQHDPTAAQEFAERAVSNREEGKTKPDLLAEARFVLAEALWSDEAQRPRARELAEQAREAFAEHAKGHEGDLAEIETWLGEHRVE